MWGRKNLDHWEPAVTVTFVGCHSFRSIVPTPGLAHLLSPPLLLHSASTLCGQVPGAYCYSHSLVVSFWRLLNSHGLARCVIGLDPLPVISTYIGKICWRSTQRSSSGFILKQSQQFGSSYVYISSQFQCRDGLSWHDSVFSQWRGGSPTMSSTIW